MVYVLIEGDGNSVCFDVFFGGEKVVFEIVEGLGYVVVIFVI